MLSMNTLYILFKLFIREVKSVVDNFGVIRDSILILCISLSCTVFPLTRCSISFITCCGGVCELEDPPLEPPFMGRVSLPFAEPWKNYVLWGLSWLVLGPKEIMYPEAFLGCLIQKSRKPGREKSRKSVREQSRKLYFFTTPTDTKGFLFSLCSR